MLLDIQVCSPEARNSPSLDGSATIRAISRVDGFQVMP